MGHEVGHVDARHSAERVFEAELAGGGLLVAQVLAPETATCSARAAASGAGAS